MIPMKIALTGATGFVGSRLVQQLTLQGHQTVIFTRDAVKTRQVFPEIDYPNLQIIPYDSTRSGSWQNALSGCDAVINLAGTPLAEKRWTPSRKKEILESRELTTQKLVEGILKANPKPSVFISTSAIGYYGTSETATFDENSDPGQDFLAEVCQRWESAAKSVQLTEIRLVILRFGIVLGRGGVLRKMLLPFQLFMGGPIGNGQQWFSWIHQDDLVNLIIYTLTQSSVKGVFNATAPHPIMMKEFCQKLGEVLHRPSWLPVPSFVLNLLLGEGSKVVLEGQRVLPKKTLTTGFQFTYPEIKQALSSIFSSV